MSTIMTTVTEYEDKALELIVKVQDEVLGYVKQAVELHRRAPPRARPARDRRARPGAHARGLVTTQFAFSKKVLTSQEKFAKNVVKAVKPLTRDAKPKAKAAVKAA